MTRRGGWWDAGLYAAAAIVSALVGAVSSIPLYGEWARLTTGPYVAGALVAALVAPRRPTVRTRAVIAVLLGIAVLVVPLVTEVARRAADGPGSHAQSEVIVTELAARALVGGHDPYGAMFLHGPLAARPLATKTHYPYLPGMLVFGLPSAIGGGRPFGDARIWFTLAALVAGGVAIARWPGGGASRLLVGQVLFVLPTGSLFAATGGDDLPVLALMGLALVLLEEDRPVGAGLALGAAMAMKQTAWVLALFVLAAALDRRRERAWRFPLACGAVSAAAIVPFALWNPGAFVENVLWFPAGLSGARSAAQTPNLGSMLIRAAPGARPAITVAIWGLVSAVAAAAILRGRRGGTAGAAAPAGAAAAVVLVAVLLDPQARAGYLVYPIDLLVWWLLLRRGRGGEPAAHATEEGVRAVRRRSMRPGGRPAPGARRVA